MSHTNTAGPVGHPKLEIALCGYAGEHKMPPDWEEVAWSSQLGKGREWIWFSPNCLRPGQRKSDAEIHSTEVFKIE